MKTKVDIEYLPLLMFRENLRAIPQYSLPAGYSARMFRPDDRKAWLRIWRAAERYEKITPKTFDGNFGSDLPAMERRCLFLVAPGGQDVGTITAWYERRYKGNRWGRIHWVAIVPQLQGRGLAKPMLAAGMNLMRSLRHRRAILDTQTTRIAAIKTYLDFGFVPELSRPDARRAWRLVRSHLPHPKLKGL